MPKHHKDRPRAARVAYPTQLAMMCAWANRYAPPPAIETSVNPVTGDITRTLVPLTRITS